MSQIWHPSRGTIVLKRFFFVRCRFHTAARSAFLSNQHRPSGWFVSNLGFGLLNCGASNFEWTIACSKFISQGKKGKMWMHLHLLNTNVSLSPSVCLTIIYLIMLLVIRTFIFCSCFIFADNMSPRKSFSWFRWNYSLISNPQMAENSSEAALKVHIPYFWYIFVLCFFSSSEYIDGKRRSILRLLVFVNSYVDIFLVLYLFQWKGLLPEHYTADEIYTIFKNCNFDDVKMNEAISRIWEVICCCTFSIVVCKHAK